MTADLTTVAVSTIILALSICLSTKLLGKRSRGEDHSLCPESKRARLDEATSSSNQVAQELTPVQEASLSADPTSPTPLEESDFPGDLVRLSSPDTDYDDSYLVLYQEIMEKITDLLTNLPGIPPIPAWVTLQEIVQFHLLLLDEEEADLVYLQDMLQDLTFLGHHSEFFLFFIDGKN
ncbi:hypothetical protein OIU78_014729 [Salix suchowensis]|jgi:hypothetical protein|nr:hypothetical protein OIU78_014729 [Salix suchowensis]